MTLSDIEKHRTDHLILLVGGNPLPNYVAARLLAKPNATLRLMHTQRTYEVAQNLVGALAQPAEGDGLGRNFTNIELVQVNSSAPRDIFSRVQEVVKKIPSDKTVGLHYTSGNRPMSVHAYDAVKALRPDAKFSYLDGNTLEMLVHDATQSTLKLFRADTLLNMRLETLFILQGLKEKETSQKARPSPLELAAALVELNSTSDGVRRWLEWRQKGSEGWTKLPKNQPGLAQVETVLAKLCGGDPTPEQIARALGYASLPSSADWWKGRWLEDYVFAKMTEAIKGRLDTNDAKLGITYQRGEMPFELDVAVMRSYQFFVFSCIASNNKQSCKDHLMEAYVRARQAGGDEARVGLVCLYSDSKSLAREISSALDAAGKIKVFGQEELPSLTNHIKDWLDNQP